MHMGDNAGASIDPVRLFCFYQASYSNSTIFKNCIGNRRAVGFDTVSHEVLLERLSGNIGILEAVVVQIVSHS